MLTVTIDKREVKARQKQDARPDQQRRRRLVRLKKPGTGTRSRLAIPRRLNLSTFSGVSAWPENNAGLRASPPPCGWKANLNSRNSLPCCCATTITGN